MELLVKGQSLLNFFNPLTVLRYAEELKCVRGIGLWRNCTGTFDHVSCLKSFFSSSWISWEKQKSFECESVLAQRLLFKTRYWPSSGKTWKIWEAEMDACQHLQSQYSSNSLKLLNCLPSLYVMMFIACANPLHFFPLVLYLCESSFVHCFSLLAALAK